MSSVDVDEIYEELLQIYRDRYTNPRYVLYSRISELAREGRQIEEAIIALYEEERKLQPVQVARAHREIITQRNTRALERAIIEIKTDAQKFEATKKASIAKMENTRDSTSKTAEEIAIIWAGICFCIGAPIALFSSHGEAEVFAANMSLLLIVMIFGVLIAYLAGSFGTEKIKSRIDILREELENFHTEIENDVNLFTQILRERKNQRKKEREKNRKQREEHEREEAIKKKVLGYLLAYKSTRIPELAKRFKLTLKQTEKILSELKSDTRAREYF